MNEVREVKKSFCVLSVAYFVLGMVLIIWPDISVKTFCYVFGIGMLIFGGTYMILYFTRERLKGVMQSEMVLGVIGIATGAYILLKMDYVLEIIPFAMGIVGLLGAMVKLQDAIDLKKLLVSRWYIMMIWSLILFASGVILVANPFEELGMGPIVKLIGISLIIDGIGNLVGIFWLNHAMKTLEKRKEEVRSRMEYPEAVRNAEYEEIVDAQPSEAEHPDLPAERSKEN